MLAIIADNQQYEDPGKVIMVDDGKGPQVKIPTVLISHSVGELITSYVLSEKKNVTVIVNFETNKRKVADVTIWMSAFDRKSYILIRNLEPFLMRINSSSTLQYI